MTKKAIFFVTFILFMTSSSNPAYSSGLGKFPPCEKMDPNESGMDHEISGDVIFSVKDLCFYRRAKEKGILKDCDKIVDTIVNESCVSAIAIAKKDYKLCFKVAEQTAKKKYLYESNRNTCLSEYARETVDPAICKIIWDGKYADPACMQGVENRIKYNQGKH